MHTTLTQIDNKWYKSITLQMVFYQKHKVSVEAMDCE